MQHSDFHQKPSKVPSESNVAALTVSPIRVTKKNIAVDRGQTWTKSPHGSPKKNALQLQDHGFRSPLSPSKRLQKQHNLRLIEEDKPAVNDAETRQEDIEELEYSPLSHQHSVVICSPLKKRLSLAEVLDASSSHSRRRSSASLPNHERPVVGFDVDGTLLDSAKALLILLQEYVQPHVNEFTAGTIRSLTEDDVRNIQATESLTQYMLHVMRFTKAELKLTLKITQQFGPDVYRQHTQLKPGARELVQQIHDCGFLPVPITNNFASVVGAALEAHGIPYVGMVSRSDDIPPKPAPDGLLLAASKFGNGTIAYHIGDSPDDYEAALAAGKQQGTSVKFIRIKSGNEENEEAVELCNVKDRASFQNQRRRRRQSSLLRKMGLPEDFEL